MEELMSSWPNEALIPIFPFDNGVMNSDIVVDVARMTVEGSDAVSLALSTQFSVTHGTFGSLPCI